MHFRPFSEVELTEYIRKREDEGRAVSQGVLGEARQLNVLLPQLFNQCSERDEVRAWVHNQVYAFLEKFGHRCRQKTCIVLLRINKQHIHPTFLTAQIVF